MTAVDWASLAAVTAGWLAGLVTRPLLRSWRQGAPARRAWRHQARAPIARVIAPVVDECHHLADSTEGLHYRRKDRP